MAASPKNVTTLPEVAAALPELVAAPVSVSRVQSSYLAGTATITFTVASSLPPTWLPEVPDSATYTETIDILASSVITTDVNTLSGVELSDSLALGTTLKGVSGTPSQNGGTLTWSLPDIPPMGSVTVTMTVQTPPQGGDFVDLDGGAQVSAVRWGEAVSASAPPAVIVPAGIDPSYTQPSPGAEPTDVDMLWGSALLGQDPQSIFELVRGFGNDPYAGSLRGTRGTLWGEAGNSADKSSLLIAMLRAAGVPARYRHGDLPGSLVTELLAGMFPARAGVGGYLPPGAAIADPLSDPALGDLVSDHWWVEAYLPGVGWTDLDPSFEDSQPGDLFATPANDGSDRVASLPVSMGYTVHLELLVEQYSQFPIGGANLTTSTPLTATYALAELASKALTLGHTVTTESAGGVYSSVTHTYAPFFTLAGEDRLLLGNEFQDLLTTFPLASSFTTAEWLNVTLTRPDRSVETFKRELKDLIGLDARLNGGNPVIALPADNRPFYSLEDAFAVWFLPNHLRETRYADRQRAENVHAVIAMAASVSALPDPLVSPDDQQAFRGAALEFLLARNQQYAITGLEFARAADPASEDIESNLSVKLFYDQPRILITSSAGQADGSVDTSLDLRSTEAAAIVYPGQAESARYTAQWTKGVIESYYETEITARLVEAIPVSVARVFDEMHAQGAQPVLITPETMDLLDVYIPDHQASAYARQALLEGKDVLIPPGKVTVDGRSVFGWWQIDPQTGIAVSVMENGQHTALLEWAILILESWDTWDDATDLMKTAGKLWACIAEAAIPALQGHPGAPADCLEGFEIPNTGWPPWYPDPIKMFPPTRSNQESIRGSGGGSAPAGITAAASWRNLTAYNCPVDNCGVEQFVLPYPNPSPIPLPEVLFGFNDRFGGGELAGKQFSVSDNGGGGPPTFTIQAAPASGSVLPGETHTVEFTADANFDGLLRLWVYAPQGWQVRFVNPGLLEAMPTMGTPPGDYTLQVVAQSVDDPEVIDALQVQLTIPDANDLLLVSAPDPYVTLPSGAPAFSAVSNQTNDGEGEYPDSAFRLGIANYSGQAKGLTLTASGAPPGWLVLNGAVGDSTTFTLGANQRTQVGLYVLPQGAPSPGTSFTIDVELSDGLGGVESLSIPWSMPAQAHDYLQLSPSELYLGANGSADFTFSLENVGNTSGSFPVSAILPPVSAAVTGVPAPVNLAVGESQAFTATLETSGVPVGTRFPLVLAAPAPDSYTQYATAMVQVVSPLTEPVFQASGEFAAACTLGEPGLSASIKALALAMVHLEASCLAGICSLPLRDQAASTADHASFYAGAVSPLVAQDSALQDIAAALASHTTDADILADLAKLSAAVVALQGEVCALSQHLPVLRWTPAYSATLVGQPAQLELSLTNEGSLPTTYALTVTLPAGVQTFSPDLDPGEAAALSFPVTIGSTGLYDLEAEASVVGDDFIHAGALARLNVVDRFVQLTAVLPDPPFVETGVSSTTLSVEVANIANLALHAIARTAILAPGGAAPGGTPAYNQDIPITLLAGAPRRYALDAVDTSGWAAGVYTITVDLLHANSFAPIPDGSGSALLGVGQALGIQHALTPTMVNPGTVTVTTVITSEILAPTILPSTVQAPQPTPPIFASFDAAPAPAPLPPAAPQTTDAITRTEDFNASFVYSGTWTAVNLMTLVRHTSRGSYTVSHTAGDTVAFTFDGTWLHLGFATGRSGGQAEVLIDGVSHGIVDLYSNKTDVASYAYGGLASGTHTLTISVLGTAHPNASGTDIKLDYADTWDGTFYPDGTVEQDSPRVWRSLDWSDVSDPDASGGSYMQNNVNGSTWFPFTGDSITFVAFASAQGQRVSLSIDGVPKANMNVYNSTEMTRTLSFDGLGAGPHVLQVRRYYNIARVDAFVTPAIEPGYVPPVYTGIVRYEADNPAILYNGYPMRTMPPSWNEGTNGGVSDSSFVGSQTLSDTVSLTFDGRWAEIGLRTRIDGGWGEVFIDGVSYGIIDSASPSEDLRSYAFGGLITGTHTLEIVILDQPNTTSNNLYLDYIDVWDGAPMPDDFTNARKAQDSGRLHYSSAGVDAAHANALQGDFVASGLPNTLANVWYSFIGDSFTFYGFTRANTSSQEIYVDGQLIDTVSLNYPFSQQPMAFHYTGFSDGPHTVRVHNLWVMQVDGFASNPASLSPFQPVVEWHESDQTRGGSIWGGLHVPPAVGDVTGDGSIEIVVASSNIQSNGELFVLRGDGGDTGDGDPILWSVPYNIFNGFEDVAAPAIAELDGQPGAEIIHPTIEGLYVYHGDGSTYWFTNTVQSHVFFAAPAVGNLDFDPEPEIVVNLNHDLVVFEPDGGIAWQQSFPPGLSMPVLADLDGDGLLDILVHDSAASVYAYDYNFGSPSLLWSSTVGTPLHIYGGPAVVDVDGMQPGGDALPEVAVASEGLLSVLNAEDGSLLWSAPLDSGRPGSVSAADLDGDGEIELVTGMEFNGGTLYAVNADGSLLWSAPALDNSPLNASVMDLDNDGDYEVAFNGANQGFTLYDGADGSVLFNEPHLQIISQTGSDFPIFADVDLDGYGEVVVPSQAGLRVFGFDGMWGPARPVWNEHSYHITNVSDDLSVPPNEPPSWIVHNTFRTQTSLVNPLPVYSIALTHTVGLQGVTVLTNTFNIPPDRQSGADYGWSFGLSAVSAQITHTFSSRLDGFQPGETRLVVQGTQAEYTLYSGRNHLSLPPLFASAVHIVAIDPPLRVAGPGGSVEFKVVLTNTAALPAQYALSMVGLPGGWVSLPAQASVPPQSSLEVPLAVSVPQEAGAESYPFNVYASDGQTSDQASGTLVVSGPLLQALVSPPERSAPTGTAVTYTLTITNLEAVDRAYDLSASGLAQVALPPQVSVGAGETANLVFDAQTAYEGSSPFTVSVAEANGYASADAPGVLTGVGFPQVLAEIDPPMASGGPGVPTIYTAMVTNLSSSPQVFAVSAAVPPSWEASLMLLGDPVDSVLVGPGAGNAVELQLMVTPAPGTTPGSYDFSFTAASGAVSDTGTASLAVESRGVMVSILSGPSALEPGASGTWQVQVTNAGASADSYDLSAFGVFAPTAQFSPGSVSLSPGESQTVQLSASSPDISLPQEHTLGVLARSQADSAIQSQVTALVTILGRFAVEIAWIPPSQTISGTLTAAFSLAVTNTGNATNEFLLIGSADPLAFIQLETGVLQLSARGSAMLRVEVKAPQGGSYTLTAAAEGGPAQDSATATLTVIYAVEPPKLYLPLVMR